MCNVGGNIYRVRKKTIIEFCTTKKDVCYKQGIIITSIYRIYANSVNKNVNSLESKPYINVLLSKLCEKV